MSDGKNRQSLLLPILIPSGALAVIALVLAGFSRVLLAVSHNAATVVALVAAAGIVGVAAWVASRKRVTGATLFSMVAAMTGIAMVAGGLAVVAAPLQAEQEEEPGVVVRSGRPRGSGLRRASRPTRSRCRATSRSRSPSTTQIPRSNTTS